MMANAAFQQTIIELINRSIELAETIVNTNDRDAIKECHRQLIEIREEYKRLRATLKKPEEGS